MTRLAKLDANLAETKADARNKLSNDITRTLIKANGGEVKTTQRLSKYDADTIHWDDNDYLAP